MKRLYLLVIFGSLLFLLNSTFAVDNEEFYKRFYESHAGLLKIRYYLPEGDDLSYWGTDPNSFFYKTQDDENNYKPPYLTKGDFNSDGKIDVCYLLFSRITDSVRLYAFISWSDGRYKHIRLTEASKGMGIRTEKISLKNETIDALNIFEFEGEYSETYIWKDSSKEFIKTQN